MRITSSMYYKNLYSKNNENISNSLFDVNKQISSGLKIQYAKDDLRTFTETMRLDNEVTVLGQTKKSMQNALKFSEQTDAVLNEFETAMNRTRTLLINAANSTNSDTSLDAIAKELRGIEKNLKDLANTSINGQYLFSGSATDIRPIANDGTYMGNAASLEAFSGSQAKQAYNISGAALFLGEEQTVNREVSTNVVQTNLIAKYPALQSVTDTGISSLTASNTIRDLMGDTDNVVDAGVQKHYFYIRGTNSAGESFKEKVAMSDDDTIDSLLTQIGNLYGNTASLKVVNVSLNDNGQIVVEDKMKGSSKLDFHIVGATDLSGGAAADVADIDDLGDGEVDFDKIMLGTSTAANSNLYVKEFIKSSLSAADSVAPNAIEGTIYDRVEFSKNGAEVSSNVPQIIKESNAFASLSTKLSEVASGTTLDGTSFVLEGVDINGNAYSATIDLATAGSTFSLDGGVTNYEIFGVQTPRAAVAADDMTYKQLMDVMNMVVTDTLPASTNVDTDYDDAVETSQTKGGFSLTYDGKISFLDTGTGNTQATIALYDSNSDDFSAPLTASSMTFNTNNALTIRDPKTDFFRTFDEIITAVENHKLYPDASVGDVRNAGIENAIAMIDDLQDHIFRSHSQVGAQTNTLTSSIEKTELLEISTFTLRSSVIDTDLAKAYLDLAQLNTNYQAMLSTIGKVSELSLVNYLK